MGHGMVVGSFLTRGNNVYKILQSGQKLSAKTYTGDLLIF